MISNEQIDDWLRDRCRRSGPSWVWPRGTVYSQKQSAEIVRVHLALGIEPTEVISIDMLSHMLRRIEHLERMFTTLGAPGAVTPVRDMIREGDPRMNLVQDLIEGDGPRIDRAAHLLDVLKPMSPAEQIEYLAKLSMCPGCVHGRHEGERCAVEVSTAKGRVCRCDRSMIGT